MVKKSSFLLAAFCAIFAFSAMAADKAAPADKPQPSASEALVNGPSGGFDADRPNQFQDKMKFFVRQIAFYIPNRLMDLSDIISFEADFGGFIAGKFQATRYLQFGGEHGKYYFAGKLYDRQLGTGIRTSTEFGIFCFEYMDTCVSEPTGKVRDMVLKSHGFDVAKYFMDAFRDDDEDFWAIGGRFGLLGGLGINIHPVEIADFVAGCVFLDFRKDDLK